MPHEEAPEGILHMASLPATKFMPRIDNITQHSRINAHTLAMPINDSSRAITTIFIP